MKVYKKINGLTPNQVNGLARVLIQFFVAFSGLYFMIRGLYATDPLLYCTGLGGLWLQTRFAG